jgi:hypothetical protein
VIVTYKNNLLICLLALLPRFSEGKTFPGQNSFFAVFYHIPTFANSAQIFTRLQHVLPPINDCRRKLGDKRDCIDKSKGEATVGNQKAQKNTKYGIAQREGQVPKHKRGKQLGELGDKRQQLTIRVLHANRQ